MFKLEYEGGGSAQLDLQKFPAMEGWDIHQEFKRFVESDDPQFRRDYTLRVLSYATVVLGTERIPLATDAIIDNHLRGWQNVKLVFEEILRLNGIEPSAYSVHSAYWEDAAKKFAVSLIAECTLLLGPGLKSLAGQIEVKKG